MQVFKFKLGDHPDLLHIMAADKLDAVLDICEAYECKEQDIVYFERVEKLSSKKVVK